LHWLTYWASLIISHNTDSGPNLEAWKRITLSGNVKALLQHMIADLGEITNYLLWHNVVRCGHVKDYMEIFCMNCFSLTFRNRSLIIYSSMSFQTNMIFFLPQSTKGAVFSHHAVTKLSLKKGHKSIHDSCTLFQVVWSHMTAIMTPNFTSHFSWMHLGFSVNGNSNFGLVWFQNSIGI